LFGKKRCRLYSNSVISSAYLKYPIADTAGKFGFAILSGLENPDYQLWTNGSAGASPSRMHSKLDSPTVSIGSQTK
jgi:hypothetical protein